MRRFLLIAAVGMIAGPANAGIVPASPYDLANLVQRGSRIEKGFLADRPILLLSTTPGRGGGAL